MPRRSSERFKQGLEQIDAGLGKKGGTRYYEKILERLRPLHSQRIDNARVTPRY